MLKKCGVQLCMHGFNAAKRLSNTFDQLFNWSAMRVLMEGVEEPVVTCPRRQTFGADLNCSPYNAASVMTLQVSRASQRHGDGRRGSTAALSGAGLSQHRPSVQHRRTSLTSSHRNEQNNPASAKIMYENTYQLQPVDEQRFKFGKVKPIVSQVMQVMNLLATCWLF